MYCNFASGLQYPTTKSSASNSAVSVAASMSQPPNGSELLFPKALIYSSGAEALSADHDPQQVWLAFASSLRWKFVNDAANSEPPRTLLDFRHEKCLELDRLHGDATWANVEDAVRPFDGNTDGGPALYFPDRTSRRFFRDPCAKTVVIVANSERERDDWIYTLRVRIAPWQAVMQLSKDLVISSGAPVGRLAQVIHDQVAVKRPMIIPNASNAIATSHCSDGGAGCSIAPIADALDAASRIPEFVESVAVVVKVLYENVEKIADTAEKVADVAKCVTVVSAAFQVVALGARLAHMVAEGARGRDLLPKLHSELVSLSVAASECTVSVLNPAAGIDDWRLKAVFMFQEECMQTLEDMENQLMRSWVVQAWNAGMVTEAESKVRKLHERLVPILNTGDVANLKETVAEMKKAIESYQTSSNTSRIGEIRGIVPMPRLSQYFVGRSKEQLKLRNILEQFGCAAITQYGGAGKTQLMLSFAEAALEQGLLPGGAYWVPVPGHKAQVLSSVVKFVEGLRGSLLPEGVPGNVRLVVADLRRALSHVKGRWMLCLDNADNKEAAEVLKEIGELAEPSSGWVLVTSRRGDPNLWSGLAPEQLLRLSPLEQKDAMGVLLRFKEAKTRNVIKRDADIYADLDNMETTDYNALAELAIGLAGLPLALVQAGSYISSAGRGFAEYVEMYKAQWKSEDLSEVFKKAEDSSDVREEQKAIWTTWKVNMRELDDFSRSVLRAVAMLADMDIPEGLMKRVVMECSPDEPIGEKLTIRFVNTVRLKLVNDASLVIMEHRSESTGHTMYKMHSLIRHYVRIDAKTVRHACQERGLRAVYTCVFHVLKEKGFNFNSLPEFYGEDMQDLLPHAVSVVNEQLEGNGLTGTEMFQTKSEPLASFAIHLLIASERAKEAEPLCSLVLPCVSEEERNPELGQSATKWQFPFRRTKKTDESKRRKDRETWLKYMLLRSQVRFMLGKLEDSEIEARNGLRISQSGEGKLPKRKLFARCRTRDDGQSFSPNRNTAVLLCQLALIQTEKGEPDEALKLYRESLSIFRVILGEDAMDREIAAVVQQLGKVMRSKGSLVEAEELYRKSLKMKRALYGENALHPSIAGSLHNLGGLMREKGNMDEAEELYRESLRIVRALYGKDAVNLKIASTLFQLGALMQHKRELGEAEMLLRESVRIKRAFYGKDSANPSIAASLHQLAGVVQANGDLEEAEKISRDGLKMLRAFYGEHSVHPDIAPAVFQLASIVQAKGNLGEANVQYRESLRLHRAGIAASLHRLGEVLKSTGDVDEGEALLHQSLILQRRLGLFL